MSDGCSPPLRPVPNGGFGNGTCSKMTVPMSRNSEVLVGEIRSNPLISYPILSMYGIFTYMGWWIFMGNVGKYTIHGCYGYNTVDGKNPAPLRMPENDFI